MLCANKRLATIQTCFARDIMLSTMHAPYTWYLAQSITALIRLFRLVVVANNALQPGRGPH